MAYPLTATLHRAVNVSPRMVCALIVSVLLHIALFSGLPLDLWRVHRGVPGYRPMPLIAHIVAQQKSGQPETRSATFPPQASHPAAAKEQKYATLSRPAPAGELPPARTVGAAAIPSVPRGGGTPGPRYGVSIDELLYQRPLPRQFANPLLEAPGFVRDTALDERPTPIDLVIPDYPQPALAAKTKGWVIVAFFLDEEGNVIDVAPVESSEGFIDFQKEVTAALRRSTFTPGKVQDQPVKSLTFQMVRFDIQRPEDIGR